MRLRGSVFVCAAAFLHRLCETTFGQWRMLHISCRPDENETGDRKGPIAMANILVNIEKGIEIGAEDALKWLTGAGKALHAAPEVVAALATLIGAVEKPMAELAGAAANPLNIPLDIQTVTDLKAVWPDVKQFLGTLGVKF
jgi:hypothetical protein